MYKTWHFTSNWGCEQVYAWSRKRALASCEMDFLIYPEYNGYWIFFEQEDNHSVVGYCDAYYACDLDIQQSTTGYVFTLAKALISWKYTLQLTVALSTIEAKYMAIIEVVKKEIKLKGFLGELEIKQKYVNVHCDS